MRYRKLIYNKLFFFSQCGNRGTCIDSAHDRSHFHSPSLYPCDLISEYLARAPRLLTCTTSAGLWHWPFTLRWSARSSLCFILPLTLCRLASKSLFVLSHVVLRKVDEKTRNVPLSEWERVCVCALQKREKERVYISVHSRNHRGKLPVAIFLPIPLPISL